MSTFTDIWDSLLGNLFGTNRSNARSLTMNVVGPVTTVKDYVNNIKTNRKLANEMYHNVNKNYSLAGHLVRPIISNNVNFIGIPTLSGNKKNIKVIEDVKIDYRKVHKALEIDGSVLIWPQWDNEKKKIKIVIVPIDVVDTVFIDPLSKEVTGYKFVEQVHYSTADDINAKVDIVTIITEDRMIKVVDGTISKTIEVVNPFGVLPIVHFSNDKDTGEIYGHCEFENIEPMLKFYHELTYESGAAQSRDGHPKLKITAAKPRVWIENNFGAGTYDKLLAGENKISMQDRDLFINGEGDDVAYLYLNKTTGDYSSLAQTTFTNIVEGSETPEINFGANLGTSLASVKEYRPVWIKKIESKQYERTEPWNKVYDLIIMIHNFVNIKSLKNDILITWPKPNFVSTKEQSEIMKSFAVAIEKLVNKGIVTYEEVYNSLVELDIFNLAETYKLHKEVIDKEVKERDERTKANAEANESGDGVTEETDESQGEGSKE